MTTQRIQQHLINLVALVAVVAGAYFFLSSLYLWLCLHVHIPIKDCLHLLPLVQNVVEHGFWSTSLNDWFATFAGAHRITITRLLMALDYRYFSGQNHLIYASAWLSIVTLLLLFVCAFRKSYRSETTLLVFVSGLALMFLCSHSQFWNLINPINSSWYVALAASALGIWMIASSPVSPSPWCFVTAYLLAIVAALSNFSGIIVWIVLPILILFRSTRAGLCAAIISAVFLALYLRGIESDSAGLMTNPKFVEQLRHSGLQGPAFFDNWWRRATGVLSSTIKYLGSPLSIDYPRLANLPVMASFLVITAGWLILLKRRFLDRSDYHVWLELTLAIATLCLGIAIATQMGRVIFSSPTADRYQTVVMVYWLCVCGLLLFFALEPDSGKPVWRLATTALCLSIAGLFLASASDPMIRSIKTAEAANRASVLAMFGVSDKAVNSPLLAIDGRPYYTEFAAFLKRYNGALQTNNTPLTDQDLATECDHVDLRLTPSRWPAIDVVSGSAEDYWANWNRRMPVSTEQGDIIGYLFPVYQDTPSMASLLMPRGGNWAGYVSAPAILNDAIYLHYRTPSFTRRACRIAM